MSKKKKKIPISYKINGQIISHDKLPRITNAFNIRSFATKMTNRLQFININKSIPEDKVIAAGEDLWAFVQTEINRSRFVGNNQRHSTNRIEILFDGVSVCDVHMQPGEFVFEECHRLAEEIDKDIKKAREDKTSDLSKVLTLKNDMLHASFEQNLIKELKNQYEEQLKNLSDEKNN